MDKLEEAYNELNNKLEKATKWIEDTDPNTITKELQSKYDELLNLVNDKYSELCEAKEAAKEVPKVYNTKLNYGEAFKKISELIQGTPIKELQKMSEEMKGKERELMSYYLIGRKCGMCEYMKSCDESLTIKTSKYNHDTASLETIRTPNPNWKCVTMHAQLGL